MQAVIREMPPHWLEERRNSDASRWDEMWDGVLHMSPQPTGEHQDLVFELAILLRERWARPNGGKVALARNLTTPEDERRWRENYRSPDILLLSKDRLGFDKDVYIAGPPLVCIECQSPDDESHEKLPFYAGLGVPEVWIIDRDSKAPDVHVLEGGAYRNGSPGADGWLRSTAIDCAMKAENGKLLVLFTGDTELSVVPK